MSNNSKVISAITSMSQQIDWDSIYTSELPKIYNFFIYKIGDRDAAQDLTGITIERAWRIRHRYRSGVASLSTWLFGIAKNVLKEYFKKNRKGEKIIESIIQNEKMQPGTDVEKKFEHQQEQDHLRNMIKNLPEREQYLISLKYGAGLTNREIAKVAKLSESNVGSILHRTVTALRSKLEE